MGGTTGTGGGGGAAPGATGPVAETVERPGETRPAARGPVFVLVSGGYTGGWLWRELVARLRAFGAEAYPVTLTGTGDRRHLGGPETTGATHVEDLVRFLDHLDEPEVILVGYCYGVYPVLAAAERRLERVARIVYLDAPMPLDGYSPLGQATAMMPDADTRARMVAQAERAEDGWRVPAPATLDEWRAAANVAGVPDATLERLHRLASPQPLGALTHPFHLTGAADALPLTGIFCTVGGMIDTAGLQELVNSGEPAVQRMAGPRAGFFDIATGHWPMLSTPDELTDVLLRAAADEGHRLTPAA
ncbi:alpha/beta fold hydrolase [Streptomyces sp. AJS327]|nr:alpha/beta fold hydrolase [Streptomyces sp. AJS327]